MALRVRLSSTCASLSRSASASGNSGATLHTTCTWRSRLARGASDWYTSSTTSPAEIGRTSSLSSSASARARASRSSMRELRRSASRADDL